MTKHITLLLVMLGIAFASRDAAADRKKLVVVVVKGSAVTNISRSDLKHAFLGDRVSAGGRRSCRSTPRRRRPNVPASTRRSSA